MATRESDWERQRNAEIDALPDFDMPAHRGCKRCNGLRGKLRENTNGQDVVYCAACRIHVYNAPKSETGKAPRSIYVRSKFKEGQRERIIAECGARCWWCGHSPAEHGVVLTLAHILSDHDGKRQGATDDDLLDDENLLPCCEGCNGKQGKYSLPPRLAFLLLKARRAHNAFKRSSDEENE